MRPREEATDPNIPEHRISTPLPAIYLDACYAITDNVNWNKVNPVLERSAKILSVSEIRLCRDARHLKSYGAEEKSHGDQSIPCLQIRPDEPQGIQS